MPDLTLLAQVASIIAAIVAVAMFAMHCADRFNR